jgi:hypothetical protein
MALELQNSKSKIVAYRDTQSSRKEAAKMKENPSVWVCRGLPFAGAQTLNRRGLDSGRGLKENGPDYVIRAAPKIREKGVKI